MVLAAGDHPERAPSRSARAHASGTSEMRLLTERLQQMTSRTVENLLGTPDVLRRELAFGTGGGLLLKAVSALLALISSVVLARLLGPSGYGIYSYAVAVATFLTVPAAFGLPNLIVREVAVYRAHRRWGEMRGLLRWSMRRVFAASLILAALAAAGVQAFEQQIDGPTAILVGLLIVPVASLGFLGQSFLRGLRRVVLAQVPDSLVRPSLFLGVIVLWALLAPDRLEATSAVWASVLAWGVALAVMGFLVGRHRPPEVLDAAAVVESKRWLRGAIPLFLIGAMNYLNIRTDILMLGVLRDAADVGLYRVAMRGAELMMLVLSVVGMVLQPIFASLHARGERVRLQRLVTIGARVTLGLSLPLGLLFIFVGRPLVAFAFGEEFREAAPPLAILSVGQLVSVSMGSVGPLLVMTGHERRAALAIGMGVLTDIGLNALLIPVYGPIGAAVATAVSMAVWSGLLALTVHRVLRLRPSAFARLGREGNG